MHGHRKARPSPSSETLQPEPRARLGSAEATPSRFKGLLGLLAMAQLMVILDITAVNVALPDMAASLDISGGNIGWAITSYSLMFGSLLLLGGRLADVVGRRRIFMTGLGMFTAASVAAAFAGSGEILFIARAAQGLGAALLSPAALAIIMATFTEGHQRTRALGVWGAVGGAGAAIGVLLGGALTSAIGWEAIFLINIPIGLVVAVAARKIIPPDGTPSRWSGLDLQGALLATASLAAFVFALSQASSAGWSSLQTLALGGIGLAGIATFATIELRTENPLLRIQRLADRGVGGGFLLMLAVSSVLFGSFLLVSLYMQNVLGTGAMVTGLAFLPLALALAAGVHVGSHVVTHAGVRIPMTSGFGVAAAGMLVLSGVDTGGSYLSDVLPGMLVAGAGLGVVLVSVSVSIMTGAREEEAGMLSGLNTTGHEIGGSIGIAALATIATGSVGHGAAGEIGDAFLAAAGIAGTGGLIAMLVLPSAASFLPKLRLAPRIAIH
jgi:EmrB/QacA subfamily drug resistance transporter